MAETVYPLKLPVVSSLPSASTYANRLLSYNGKVYFSDGTQWLELGGSGGGGGVSGSGTVNRLARWTGTYSIGNSIIIDNGTRISVGTSGDSSFFFMIDDSYSSQEQLTYGNEFLVNGEFTNNLSGWTIGGSGNGWYWSNGRAYLTSGSYDSLSQTFYCNTTYPCLLTITHSMTSGGLEISIDKGVGNISVYGTFSNYTYIFFPQFGQYVTLTIQPYAASPQGYIESISLKPINPLQKYDFRVGNVYIRNRHPHFFIGQDSGSISQSSGMGSGSIAIGYYAMQYALSDGSIAIGGNTLSRCVHGSYNIVMGLNALKNLYRGSNNIAIGSIASELIEGSDNIFIGSGLLGTYLTKTSGSIFIGKNVYRHLTDDTDNQLNIGNLLFGTVNNGPYAGGNLGVRGKPEMDGTGIHIYGDTIRIDTKRNGPTYGGYQGEICWDSEAIYIRDTNKWKKAPLVDADQSISLSGSTGFDQPSLSNSNYWCPYAKNQTAVTTLALTSLRMYLIPFAPDFTSYLTDWYIQVTTAASGASVKIGFYESASYSGRLRYPTNLIATSGNLDASTTGIKAASFSNLSFTKGTVYWMAIVSNAAPTLRALATGSVLYPHFSLSGTSCTVLTHLYMSLSSFELPSSASGSLLVGSGAVPAVFCIVSS